MIEIQSMDDATNLEAIEERIVRAVGSGIAHMAMHHRCLPGKCQVPSFDELLEHIRDLAEEATRDFWLTLRHADPQWLPEEIEGHATDDSRFDVFVTGLPNAQGVAYRVDVLERLT